MKKTLLLAFLPLFMVACSSSDDNDNSLGKSHFTLNYKETEDIGGEGSLMIDNDFVASYENGKITGDHIGETDAIYDGSQKIKITVNGTSTYLNYPVTDWGISMSDVKNMHRGGSLKSEDSEILMYVINSGSRAKYIYVYSFENGKLESSGLCAPTTEVKNIVEWLSQKYTFSMTGDDDIFSAGMDAYSTNKATTIIGIGARSMSTSEFVSSYAYLIVFVPANTSRGTTEDTDTEAEIDKLHQIVKRAGLAE